jgi:glucose-6-phosphate 1-dehydrogenase
MPPEASLADPLRYDLPVDPAAVVIFGATGDLTRRKLMPALFRLAYERRLPAGFAVVGVSRTRMSDEEFRERMRAGVEEFLEQSPFDAVLWRDFERGLFYLSGDVNDTDLYSRLKQKLEELERTRQTAGNALFYLSTQPSHYAPAAAGLGAAGLARAPRPDGWRRLIVEKPFGHDGSSAAALNVELRQVFAEQDIYRIDHYLGKETVQNILAFRFGNGIFEPLWNRRYVRHVQITAAESIGVEGRGAYYQEAGALRDMIQNHLLQVMATMAMEPPAAYDPDAVRDERAKLLRAIRIWKPEEAAANAVAGQYGRARIGGVEAPGFREELGVDPEAQTDTYAAVTLEVDNWRWAGVPFYIRTGKRLPKRVTDIAIEFNRAPLALFEKGTHAAQETYPNLLVLRIQPEEGISLRFFSKQPGSGMRLRPVTMDFNYGTSFGMRSPSAYETLLLDALQGDPTLYTRQDMVEASWAVVSPVLDHWSGIKHAFPNYAAGSWGPEASDAMLARRGHVWRVP